MRFYIPNTSGVILKDDAGRIVTIIAWMNESDDLGDVLHPIVWDENKQHTVLYVKGDGEVYTKEPAPVDVSWTRPKQIPNDAQPSWKRNA